jgi:phage terminase large subunit-like protein
MMMDSQISLIQSVEEDFELFTNYILKMYLRDKYFNPSHLTSVMVELEGLKNGSFDYTYLCVSIPPRTFKTTLISVLYPFWLLINDNDINIIIVTYSQEYADTIGRLLKNFIMRYGYEFNLYLASNNMSVRNIRFSGGRGNIRLVGANGGISGRNADYVIIDDLIKGNPDDYNPTNQEKLYDWFKGTLYQRVEPHTRLIIIGTRYSAGDIFGRILDEENFSKKFKFINKPIMNRMTGELLLSEEKFPREWVLSRIEEVGEVRAAALYYCEPIELVGTGHFLVEEIIHNPEPINTSTMMIVRSFDIAATEGGGDYTASVKVAFDREYYHLIDASNSQVRNPLQEVKDVVTGWDDPNVRLCVEKQPAAAGVNMQDHWDRELALINRRINWLNASGDKKARSSYLQTAIFEGKVVSHLPEEYHEFVMDQLKGFPNAPHDDLVDAFSYAMIYINTKKKWLPIGFGGQ